jgi:hypothetical protein
MGEVHLEPSGVKTKERFFNWLLLCFKKQGALSVLLSEGAFEVSLPI